MRWLVRAHVVEFRSVSRGVPQFRAWLVLLMNVLADCLEPGTCWISFILFGDMHPLLSCSYPGISTRSNTTKQNLVGIFRRWLNCTIISESYHLYGTFRLNRRSLQELIPRELQLYFCGKRTFLYALSSKSEIIMYDCESLVNVHQAWLKSACAVPLCAMFHWWVNVAPSRCPYSNGWLQRHENSECQTGLVKSNCTTSSIPLMNLYFHIRLTLYLLRSL